MRNRISGLCYNRPHYMNTCYGLLLGDDYPIGAGIDAPERIPAGSCRVYLDSQTGDFVAPTTIYRDYDL